jgi:inosine-uridine nucleoside N-ribohydrolase
MRQSRIVLLTVLIGLVSTGCAGSDSPQTSPDSTLVVVDSDGAFDDIKAILYLLEQPDVEILALTFSGTGITHCPAAAANAAAVLELIEAPDIPVACGRTTPLAGDNQAPQAWRNAADTLGNVALPEPREFSEDGAADLLRDTIEQADRNVTVVALGPLTNVAAALEEAPDLLDRVDMVYLMGGAVDAGGNVLYGNAGAEFNIWADPTAASMVFATDVPITLVPLDATNDVPVTPYLYDAVAAHRDASAVSRFVADYLDVTPLLGGLYHWDELAAVVATDESVVTLEDRKLSIVTGPEGEEGVTLEEPGGRPVRVAVAADAASFEAHFYQAILGVADPGVPPWEADAVLSWDGTSCAYEGPDPLPDDLYLRLDNNSTDFLVFITGSYDSGTTAADFDAFVEAGGSGQPDWWQPNSQIVVPAGAHDVWPVRGSSDLTGLCYIDQARVWEMVGPRLPEA